MPPPIRQTLPSRARRFASKKQWWAALSVRPDSGLVAHPSDPVEVARDADYSDLLPYVNLTANPARVRLRTVTDINVGHEHYRGDKKVITSSRSSSARA